MVFKIYISRYVQFLHDRLIGINCGYKSNTANKINTNLYCLISVTEAVRINKELSKVNNARAKQVIVHKTKVDQLQDKLHATKRKLDSLPGFYQHQLSEKQQRIECLQTNIEVVGCLPYFHTV